MKKNILFLIVLFLMLQTCLRTIAAVENVNVERQVERQREFLGQSLWVAIETKQIDKIKKYIAQGAPLDYDDFEEYNTSTLLLKALSVANEEIVNILLDAKADVNQVNKHGHAPLIQATYWNNLSGVTQLLEANANIDIQEANGNTALIAAVKKGHSDIIKKLVLYDADVNLTNKNGETAWTVKIDYFWKNFEFKQLVSREQATRILQEALLEK